MNQTGDKILYVITGCTGVGKSKFALAFAKENNGEIVSCDSMSVYRHMDIGTAKPTEDDRNLVAHHCIDLVEPDEVFNISMYVSAAKRAINTILNKGKNVIIVGGTGFYLKSFFFPVVDDVAVPDNIKEVIANKFSEVGLYGLVDMLMLYNDGVCPAIDVKNPRRVMSALGRCLSAGCSFSKIYDNFRGMKSEFAHYRKHTILLARTSDELKYRVHDRIINMFEAGFIDEVRKLVSGYHLRPSARNAIGYRETIAWLERPTTMQELVANIENSTNKLIKKQKTWLRKQIPIDEQVLLS